MGHCVACDKLLSDFEATRKTELPDGRTDYLDMCNGCFKESGLSKIINITENDEFLEEYPPEE